MKIFLIVSLIVACYSLIIWAIIYDYKEKKENINKTINNIKSRGYKTISYEEYLNWLKIAPAKPWYIRLWRKFFPLKYVEVPADGVVREFNLK